MKSNEIKIEKDLTQAEYYMNECFDLAKQGLGRTSPNPIVGAIVLDKEGIPVSKGYHKKSGFEHAEVIAIKEAGAKTKDGTLILNLEPCVHFGKTPPCTDLIIKSQIKEVVFSNYDPNPEVHKKGEQLLLKNNIQVFSKVLEQEGAEINKFFFKWMNTKIPWITLKQAQTLDGIVGIKNKPKLQITNERSKKEVHGLRNAYDAILVGANTVNIDNPELTVREIDSKVDIRNPIRIILDTNLTTKPDANVYKNNAEIILVTRQGYSKENISKHFKSGKNINIIELPFVNGKKLSLKDLFLELGKRGILSVLVEAGPNLAGELIANNLIDEYILFISSKVFPVNNNEDAISSISFYGKNKPLSFKIFDYKAIGNDLMVMLRP